MNHGEDALTAKPALLPRRSVFDDLELQAAGDLPPDARVGTWRVRKRIGVDSAETSVFLTADFGSATWILCRVAIAPWAPFRQALAGFLEPVDLGNSVELLQSPSTAIPRAIDLRPVGKLSGVRIETHQGLREQLSIRRAALNQWNEEDGDSPSDQAFDDAEAFLDLIPARVPQPSVYASGDAEVGFSWMQRAGFAEVAFRGDGNIRYAVRAGPTLVGKLTPFRVAGAPHIPLELKTALERL